MLNDFGMHLVLAIEELARASLASVAQAQVCARLGPRGLFNNRKLYKRVLYLIWC
jgi:hypothetical protein